MNVALKERLRAALARHTGRHTAVAVAMRWQRGDRPTPVRRVQPCEGSCPCHEGVPATVRIRAVVMPGQDTRSVA